MMEYVSPEYQKQLEQLAEQLVTPERFSPDVAVEIAQLALFAIENEQPL